MTRKDKFIQNTNSNANSNINLFEIDRLVKQLDLVKHLSESGYWITTEELCLLLGLDETSLQTLNSHTPRYNFTWRNFTVTHMECQQHLKMWAITNQQQPFSQVTSKPSQLIIPNQQTTLQQDLQENGIVPSAYVVIENFLSQQELAKFLKYTQEQEANFVPATIYTKDINYRRTYVLHEFPEFSQLLVQRVMAIAPQILLQLDTANFHPSMVEAQLTMNNDGNYYKIHNDNGSPDTANRVWTFVYYFYREPKGFTGGELLLYDSKIENGFYVEAKSYKTIQPKNNTVVFFLSRCLHEVLPVKCPSKQFLDSRFAVTCWVRN